MNKDVYGILGDLTAEILLEIIAECMDDYLYVIDLQNNKMEISQSALDRFMISETHVRNVKQEIMSVVYKEDRTMFAKHMQAVMDGKEKVHDIHYRWLDKNGLPVWVNCRHCMNTIYNSVPLSLHQYMEQIRGRGLRAVRLDFTDESGKKAAYLARFFAGEDGNAPDCYTTGHYKKGVQ